MKVYEMSFRDMDQKNGRDPRHEKMVKLFREDGVKAR